MVEGMKAPQDWAQTSHLRQTAWRLPGTRGLVEGLDADIYLARPYASWERGNNGSTNGLLGRYFPKQTDCKQVPKRRGQQVVNGLHDRPRKTRGHRAPNECLHGVRATLLAT